MKKPILFFAALFIINMASAQSYFGYCTAQVNGRTYVSEVVDLTTLPNNNIPKIAPYGKIKLADYYGRVAKQWFTEILSHNGVDTKNCEIFPQLIAGTHDLSNTCKTGHESDCLCQNIKAAIAQRDINLKADPKTSILK